MQKFLTLMATLFLGWSSMYAQTPESANYPSKVYSGTPFSVELEIMVPSGSSFANSGNMEFKFQEQTNWQSTNYTTRSTENVSGGQKKVIQFVVLASKTTGNQSVQWRLSNGNELTTSIQVDQNVLLGGGRITVGYQGWFGTPNDGHLNRWNHWFENNNDQSHPTQDLWPQVNADDFPDRKKTDLKFNDGSDIYLYSNADQSTANTHVKWMSEYGLQAFFVGRFLEPLANNANFKAFRDRVMDNMVTAAENPSIAAPDLKIALFYNLTTNPNASNADTKDYLNEMWNDWKDVVDNKNWISSNKYLFKNNKPVIRIYGIGFKNRPSGITAAEAKNTIRRFTDPTHPDYREKYSAYIIGGVPSKWHVGGGDAFTSNEWQEVYESYDMIQPWLVNRYQNNTAVDNWTNNVLIPDMVRINEMHGQGKQVGYLPLIFPGFSWYNINGAYNVTPRNGGTFYWRQAYKFLEAGAQNLMIANFDEVDEGTAIYKCAVNEQQVPDKAQFTNDWKFLHYNTDQWEGKTYPADWYLQLTREIRKMVLEVNPLQSQIPIEPNGTNPTPPAPNDPFPQGYFIIRNKATAKGIRPQETTTDAKIYNGQLSWVGDYMQWSGEAIDDETFYLINKAQEQKLWAPNGDNGFLLLKPIEWTGNKTRWKIEQVDQTYFRLVNVASNKYISPENNEDGSFIKEVNFTNDDKLLWYWDLLENNRVLQTTENQVLFFPNPVEHLLYFAQPQAYQLFSTDGILLSAGITDRLDMSSFPAGLYLVHIQGQSHKVIKQ
ncbi:hypothetical protein [Persicobacter diffluens]|uniref:Secretion system C-terminal sorting domain-containing protein n=1 Tax=Persicobacter diffluens TaxID=981 RepID=A0AAN4W2T5_9BACT|nr:hypothetical protein PEDI_46240 [Persicobacter diffluens]